MNNYGLKDGTAVDITTKAEVTTSSPNNANPTVIELLKAFREHYNKQHYEEISMSDIDDFVSLL